MTPSSHFPSGDLTYSTFVTLNVPVNILHRLESLHHLQMLGPHGEQQGRVAVVVQDVDVDVFHLAESLDNVEVAEETGLQ